MQLFKPSLDLTGASERDFLVAGNLRLRLHSAERLTSRCGQCKSMIAESLAVWIPDGTFMGDTFESIQRREKSGRWNGGSTAWCVKCAIKLISKAGGPTPAIEHAPIVPPAPVLSAEEIAEGKSRLEAERKAHNERERHKQELARALTSRVLTSEEIREVASFGVRLFVTFFWDSGRCSVSGSYHESELQQRLQTAWLIQTNLRLADQQATSAIGNCSTPERTQNDHP